MDKFSKKALSSKTATVDTKLGLAAMVLARAALRIADSMSDESHGQAEQESKI